MTLHHKFAITVCNTRLDLPEHLEKYILAPLSISSLAMSYCP